MWGKVRSMGTPRFDGRTERLAVRPAYGLHLGSCRGISRSRMDLDLILSNI